jgi:hypothetical protein
MYVEPNYRSKAALKRDVAKGVIVTAYQPGGFFPGKTDGIVAVEGPHFPEPHKWYARVELRDGVVVRVIA